MRPAESFVGQSVRSLQTMLRVIAESEPEQFTVIPDGIYGQNTRQAVSNYQQRKGLPVTGVTDQATWDSIVGDYKTALVLVDEAEPIAVIFEPNEVIRIGQRHPNVYLAQGILAVLSDVHSSIRTPGLTGILDLPTSRAISDFQQLSLLPMTGELDRLTWRHLALQYSLASRLSLRGG